MKFVQSINFSFFIVANVFASTVYIKVNYVEKTERFKHFWRSTGLCPPDPKNEAGAFLTSRDERLNLAIIGALPFSGITHVRIHWLINLIQTKRLSNGTSYFDFSILDTLIDWLREGGLYPGFELMGQPASKENIVIKDHYTFWRDVTQQISERYIARYSLKTVKKWRFETWNEPDLKNYNTLNFTLPDYLSYVNGCADGLGSVFRRQDRVKFGGPAGLFKLPEKHPLCWGLLETCNALKENCPLKYISFHKKGEGSIETLLNGTIQLLDYFHFKYANLRRLPVANDEADILTNWSKNETWRGDTRYASMVVQVIMAVHRKIISDRKLKVEVLSNDNAFINYHPFYFTQRTLLTRFQMNNTNPPHIQFVKKPVYIAMGLLSLVGDEVLRVDQKDPLVWILASRCRKFGTFNVVVVFANNNQSDVQAVKDVNVRAENLENGARFVVYLLDNVHTNPFDVWTKAGSPAFPPKTSRHAMREAEGPFRLIDPTEISGNELEVRVNMSLPSIMVVHVCSRNSRAPGRVTGLRAYNVTCNEVLLVWNDNQVGTRCLKTYEVEFLPEGAKKFMRINDRDTIFPSHHFATEDGINCNKTNGRYRVRAVDFWNNKGKYSQSIYF